MKFSSIISSLAALTTVLAAPRHVTRTPPADFVYAHGGEFKVNNTPLKVAGANAYWMFLASSSLFTLNEDADIFSAFSQYKATGVDVVRIWAFREVLWQNGVATPSQGALSRFGVILDAAQQHGMKVVMTLTNNWSVDFPANSSKPSGFYSNSFGGIDTYVQQIRPGASHDTFYTDPTIIAAYKAMYPLYQKYLSFVIPAFKSHPALFSWELANDPRCQGAIGTNTTSTCNTATITTWVKGIAAYVKNLDSNHLLGAGDSGFFCTQPTCPKINGASPARRSTDLKKRWEIAGPAYNGHFGVDTLDICNDENIDICSVQAFPSFNNFGQSATDTAPGTTREAINSIVDFVNFHHSEGPKSVLATPYPILETARLEPHPYAPLFIRSKPIAFFAFGLTDKAQAGQLNNFDSTNIGSAPGVPVATEWEELCAFQTIAHTFNSINAYFLWQQTIVGLSSKTGSIISGGASSKRQTNIGSSPNDGLQVSQGTPAYQQAINNNHAITG
ncbi:hypothetical protein FRB96_005251 [Tulasnella sp. 330]|nr:hypothetical protein FRB96_005251 [Tulasnella sp. 330]